MGVELWAWRRLPIRTDIVCCLIKYVVVETWMGIYQIDSFERRWDVDFDAYGLEAQNPEDAELKTYVSVK